MEELEVLVENVAVNKQLWLEKFSDTTTNERKKKVWKNLSLSISETISGDKQVFNDLSDVMFVVWFYGGK